MYFYLSRQIPEISEISKKPAEEKTVKTEEAAVEEETIGPEEISPLPEEELPKIEGTVPEKKPDGQPNIDEIFRDVFGDRLNAVTPEDPNFFMGASIGQYAFDTSWLSCQPMINKVNELTGEKSTNYEKARSIANWVMKSRNYSGTISFLGQGKNICEVFQANAGVCHDAAYLTVAMLRLTGVPSRVVAWRIHSYTEFYSDGKWLGVDSTFCNDINDCPGHSVMTEKTSTLRSFKYIKLEQPIEIIKQEGYKGHYTNRVFHYLVDSVIVSTQSKKDLLSDYSSLTTKGYQTKKIEWGELTYINPYYELPYNRIMGAKLEAKNLRCNEYSCGEASGVNQGISLVPGILVVATKQTIFENDKKTEEKNNVVSDYPFLFEDYYITFPIPPGEYRFWYGTPEIAYIDINIEPGEKVEIKPDMLIKSDNITQKEFNDFITYLKTVK